VFKEKNEVINLSKFSSSEWVFTLQPSISENSGASEGNIIQVVDLKSLIYDRVVHTTARGPDSAIGTLLSGLQK
jgi:hypothetical protein